MQTAQLAPLQSATGVCDTQQLPRVCRYLHVVLCFSPVGDKFRIRARQFPALVNCTAFDWFHGWPHQALVSVAQRFLVDIPDIEDDVRDNISTHMAFVHTEVTTASVHYFQSVRRYCYTTPKSYLELISLYKTLLAQKRESLAAAKDRLVSGVEKIAQASAQVEDLQKNLVEEQKIVAEKKEKTGALIEAIGKEKIQVRPPDVVGVLTCCDDAERTGVLLLRRDRRFWVALWRVPEHACNMGGASSRRARTRCCTLVCLLASTCERP